VAQENAKAASLFFEVAFPRHRPSSIKELDRIRTNRNVQRLRDEIAEASATGRVLEPDYPQRVLEEVVRIEAGASKKRRLTGWFGSLTGFLPYLEPVSAQDWVSTSFIGVPTPVPVPSCLGST
jgi:hypothetical protein